MKKRLLELLSQVPGNGHISQTIRSEISGPDCDKMLAELRCSALDNGAYFQQQFGKEAYELLLEVA